ncbi:hypothetical protein S40288_11216 [Stachybotrys chartarum IBT 40288]|nr:hypothetical protein S40288_11216 [Stachybotrys chartarum IBT 40288]
MHGTTPQYLVSVPGRRHAPNMFALAGGWMHRPRARTFKSQLSERLDSRFIHRGISTVLGQAWDSSQCRREADGACIPQFSSFVHQPGFIVPLFPADPRDPSLAPREEHFPSFCLRKNNHGLEPRGPTWVGASYMHWWCITPGHANPDKQLRLGLSPPSPKELCDRLSQVRAPTTTALATVQYIDTERRCPPVVVSKQYWGDDICGMTCIGDALTASETQAMIADDASQVPAANANGPGIPGPIW